MAKYFFTVKSLTGYSQPTVAAMQDDRGVVRVFSTYDGSEAATTELKDQLKLFGVGLQKNGSIDWASVRVEPFSNSFAFDTLPLSALPTRTTDNYILAGTSSDLLGASADFFATTVAKIALPSKLPISTINILPDVADTAGLDLLQVNVDQLTKILKAGAAVSNVTLSVVDSYAKIKDLMAMKPADLKVAGRVEIALNPDQFASLTKDTKISDTIVKGFSDAGIGIKVAVQSTADLSALIANNPDFSSYTTGKLNVVLGDGLIAQGTGALSSGTDVAQNAKAQQLVEFMAAFNGKTLTVDPGVVMRLMTNQTWWNESAQNLNALKANGVEVRVEASLDRMLTLDQGSPLFRADHSYSGYNWSEQLTVSSPSVLNTLSKFATSISIVTDNDGASFTNTSTTANNNAYNPYNPYPQGNNTPTPGLNSQLLGVIKQPWANPDHPSTYYSGLIGKIYESAYAANYKGDYYANNNGSGNPGTHDVAQATAAAHAAVAGIELKSASGNLNVSLSLVEAAEEMGFKFAAKDNVVLNLGAAAQSGGAVDLLNTFQATTWSPMGGNNTVTTFAGAGSDGKVDTIEDLKALGIRYKNWYNLGDIDKDGQDDAWQSMFIPSKGYSISKLDWYFGGSFWSQDVQDWLNDSITTNQFLQKTNQNSYDPATNQTKTYAETVGLVDSNGDGYAEMPSTGTLAIQFSVLKGMTAAGVDSLIAPAGGIQIVPDGGFTLKSIVQYLKTSTISITNKDGSAASINIDISQIDEKQILLGTQDIKDLQARKIALFNQDGTGIIQLAVTQKQFGDFVNDKAFDISVASGFYAAGVSNIKIIDGKTIELTVAQAKALAVGGLAFDASAFIVLKDSAANIGALSAAQIAALGAMQLDKIIANDAKEITLTDRQAKALTQADIVVSAESALRIKLTDDFLVKQIGATGNMGEVADYLSSIGADTIGGSKDGLQLTSKMFADMLPYLYSTTNPSGLLKVVDAKNTAFKADKPYSGLVVTYTNDAELGFLPSGTTQATLKAAGVTFVKTEVKTFMMAESPKLDLVEGQDIVIKATDILAQKDAAGKTVALTDLSLVDDKSEFTVKIKIDPNKLANLTSSKEKVDFAAHLLPDAKDPLLFATQSWNQQTHAVQMDTTGTDVTLPRFVLRKTADMDALLKSSSSGLLTIEVKQPKAFAAFQINEGEQYPKGVFVQDGYFVNSGGVFCDETGQVVYDTNADGTLKTKSFDVEFMKSTSSVLSKDYNWLTGTWNPSGGGFEDNGDFVAFRVVNDAEFTQATGIAVKNSLPESSSDATLALLERFTLEAKKFAASDVLTVQLNGQAVQATLEDPNTYTLKVTGADLKAGNLVITPDYGSIGPDGKSVFSLSVTGGQKETVSFNLSSLVSNDINWWQRTTAQEIELKNSNDTWLDAYEQGGTITSYGSWTGSGYQNAVVSLTQRSIKVDIPAVGTAAKTSVTIFVPAWTASGQDAAFELAQALNGKSAWGWGEQKAPKLQDYTDTPNGETAQDKYDAAFSNYYTNNQWWFKYHGLSINEVKGLTAFTDLIQWSAEKGSLVATWKVPGDMPAITISEGTTTEAGAAIDSDGNDLSITSATVESNVKTITVNAVNKLAIGDKFHFQFAANGNDLSLDVTIATADIAAGAKQTDATKVSAEILKSALVTALKAATPTGLASTATKGLYLSDNKTLFLDEASVTINSTGGLVLTSKNLTTGTKPAIKWTVVEQTQTSEAGTLGVIANTVDGSGGEKGVTLNAQAVNKAPVVTAISKTTADGVAGKMVVSLANISIDDDTSDLLVTLAPTRGLYGGTFATLDTSALTPFLTKGLLVLSYLDKDGKTQTFSATNLAVLDSGITKLMIETHQGTLVSDGQVFKASDIATLALSSIGFAVNRSLYDSSYGSAKVDFDVAVTDTYDATKKVFDQTNGTRTTQVQLQHQVFVDETGDSRVDAADAEVKLTSLTQLVTNKDVNDNSAKGWTGNLVGLHRADSSQGDGKLGDVIKNVNENVSQAKVFKLGSASLADKFTMDKVMLMVDQGLSSTTAINVHDDGSFSEDQVVPKLTQMAQANVKTIFNESNASTILDDGTTITNPSSGTYHLTSTDLAAAKVWGYEIVSDLNVTMSKGLADNLYISHNLKSLSSNKWLGNQITTTTIDPDTQQESKINITNKIVDIVATDFERGTDKIDLSKAIAGVTTSTGTALKLADINKVVLSDSNPVAGANATSNVDYTTALTITTADAAAKKSGFTTLAQFIDANNDGNCEAVDLWIGNVTASTDGTLATFQTLANVHLDFAAGTELLGSATATEKTTALTNLFTA